MKIARKMLKTLLPQTFIDRIAEYRFQRSLSPGAICLQAADADGLGDFDLGPEEAIRASLGWICVAQDQSLTQDGGVARSFSMLDGWTASYPETTGYIIPTLIAESKHGGDKALITRAQKMLDWLIDIQYPCGGFQGGMVNETPKVPVTFNTGQILLGLAAGARELEESRYEQAMLKAANWLVETQDDDGCWRRHPTPFAEQGVKAYETHVSWGLFEAARVVPESQYADSGLKQVQWAITNQRDNGWFDNNCLSDRDAPLTHTIGYVLRGILEAYRFSGDERFRRSSLKTGVALLDVIGQDGHLPGRLTADWKANCEWVCLTGSVQIAHCMFLLFGVTRDKRFLEAGRKLNSFVRRTVTMQGSQNVIGGIRGSFPIGGEYGSFEYLNWASKFFIDSNRAELQAIDQ